MPTHAAIVAVDLNHRLLGFADRFGPIDFADHPWAALPAGVVLCATAPERGRQVLERAIVDFEAAGDERGLGLACFVLGNEELAWGRVREADELWCRAHVLLDGETPADGLALAHRALAAYQQGQLLGAFRLAEEALHAARMQNNVRAEATAAVYVGFLCWWVGNFTALERAMDIADAALEAIDDPLDRYELPLAILGRAVVAAARGDDAEADDQFAGRYEVASSMDNTWYVAILRTLRAELLARVDVGRSVADAQAALQYFRETGETWWSNWALLALAVVQRESGLLYAARSAIDTVLDADLNPFERGRALLSAGEIAAASGDHERAVRELTSAVDALADVGADFWAARAEVALAGIDTGRTAYLLRAGRASGRSERARPGLATGVARAGERGAAAAGRARGVRRRPTGGDALRARAQGAVRARGGGSVRRARRTARRAALARSRVGRRRAPRGRVGQWAPPEAAARGAACTERVAW